jgi:hypothetical protein
VGPPPLTPTWQYLQSFFSLIVYSGKAKALEPAVPMPKLKNTNEIKRQTLVVRAVVSGFSRIARIARECLVVDVYLFAVR